MLAFALALAILSPWANLADPVFRRIDTTGLPHPAVYALAQDDHGFIWIGTPAGLTRYDGYEFKNYVQSTTPGAPPEVEALLAGSSGKLWIGTRSSGLVVFDEAKQTFNNLPPDPHGRTGPRSASVIALAQTPNGNIAVGGDAGLDLYDPVTNSFLNERLVPRGAQPRVESIFIDRAKTMWVGTLGGLYHRGSDEESFRRVDPRATISLYQDSSGNIWTGSLNELTERDSRGRIVQRFVSAKTSDSLAPGEQWATVETAPGIIWSGTYDSGISIVDTATRTIHRIEVNRANPGSFASGQVWQIMRDRSGLIWIANGPGGLLVFNPHAHGIYEIFEPATLNLEGLTARVVAAAPNDTLWLGGGETLIARDARTGATTVYALPRHLSIQALHVDADGTLWIGTLQGACRLPAGASAIDCPTQFEGLGRVLAIAHIGHVVWLGTSAGAIAYDQRTGARTTYRHATSTDTLSNDFVLALFPDHDGLVWAGTSAGLNRIDPRSHHVLRIVHDPKNPRSLGPGAIFALEQDRFGRIWAGAVGGSLNVLTPASSRAYTIRHLGVADGLPSEDIASLGVDERGFLWAATVQSLSRIDPSTLAIRTFGSADGVSEKEYWSGAVSRGSNGTLFFAGTDGVTAVDASTESIWQYQPRVVFTQMAIGNMTRDLDAEFAALDYSDPQALRYEYRLAGYDRSWIEADAQHRRATYTNLNPGDYTLMVRGSNRLGMWSSDVASLSVHVPPAWYQTWWFRTLLALLVVAGAFLLHYTRTAVLRRNQHRLEAMVAERTLELSEANAKLEEASLTDPLTGLRNRRFLTQHLETDIAATLRDGTDLIFFMVDLDHFKHVNDEYGHHAGDLVLTQMRDRLQHVFRESDYVIRWGGEEFLGIARASKRDEAPEIAERIRRSIGDQPFELEGNKTLVKTGSIGFATFPFIELQPKALTWLQVVEIADQALYLSKNNGRNAWHGLASTRETDARLLSSLLAATPDDLAAKAHLAVYGQKILST